MNYVHEHGVLVRARLDNLRCSYVGTCNSEQCLLFDAFEKKIYLELYMWYTVFFFQLNCKADDAKLVKIESYADDNFVRVHAMELTSKTLNAWFYDQQPSTCRIIANISLDKIK